ncbi:MAG: hypothetical protein WBG46_06105 [Nonlabens sp.]
MPNNNFSLATDQRQLVLIYNSDIKNHREIFAYAQSSDKEMLGIDISKTQVASTVWTEIADLLEIRVLDLVKTDHSTFITKYGKDHEVTCNGAIQFLQKDPSMLIYPIAIKGDTAKEVELYGHMQDFFGTDTAAVDIP